MELDVFLRKNIFFFIDFLKGGQVKKHYNEIKQNYYNGIDEKLIEDNINKLLQHAKDTTQFYSKYKNINNISDFPVVNKMTYIQNYDEFISHKFRDKKLHKMSTSGSTGTPFTVVQDMNKRKRVMAELIFYGEICNYKLGMKQAYFRVWTEKVKKSKLQVKKQNLVMVDISNLDDKRLSEIEHDICKSNKVKNILSYASTLDLLSKYLDEKNKKPQDFIVKSIISSSELLQNSTRDRLKKVFGCPVISRYSNQENGILAQECINYEEFHLNNACYYFEVLKLDSDEYAEEGEIGRIVITDLFNYAMPIIRYDTGDTGVIINNSKCGIKSMVLSELYGRRVDMIYDVEGKTLSPHVITNNMWGVEGINQFTFIQENTNSYRILINTDKDINDEIIINKFKNVLGESANIYIEYVEEIPVLASGKRKYIQNMMAN